MYYLIVTVIHKTKSQEPDYVAEVYGYKEAEIQGTFEELTQLKEEYQSKYEEALDKATSSGKRVERHANKAYFGEYIIFEPKIVHSSDR